MKVFRIGFQSYLDRINPFRLNPFRPSLFKPFNKKCDCIEHKCLDCKCSSPHYHHFNIYDYILGSIAFIKDSVHNFNAFIINKNKNKLAKIGNKNDKI